LQYPPDLVEKQDKYTPTRERVEGLPRPFGEEWENRLAFSRFLRSLKDFFEMPSERPLIVGISGASGIAYAVRLLEILGRLGIPSHLIMTRPAEVTLAHELPLKVAQVRALATAWHKIDDFAAAPSSGSFRTRGMVVVPCSARTLGAIASGSGETLLTRAADVTLKERRRLVLMVRETPLHLGHIRAMATVTELGAVVAPPMPAFYAKPQSLDELIDHSVGRLLDLFDIDAGLAHRWREADTATPPQTASPT